MKWVDYNCDCLPGGMGKQQACPVGTGQGLWSEPVFYVT